MGAFARGEHTTVPGMAACAALTGWPRRVRSRPWPRTAEEAPPLARLADHAGVVLVAVVAIGTLLVQSLPPFGGELSGERLARAKANPHYRDGAFVNPLPPAPYTWAYVRDLLAGQFGGSEAREPPMAMPLVRVTPASLQSRCARPARVLDRPRQRLHRDRWPAPAGRPGVLRPRLAVRVRAEALPSAADRAGRAAEDRRGADHARPLRPPRHAHGAARWRSAARCSSCRWASARTWSAGACPPDSIRDLEWGQEHVLRQRAHRVDAVAPLLGPRVWAATTRTLWTSWSVLGARHRVLRQRRHRLLGPLRAHRRAARPVRSGVRQDRRLWPWRAVARHPHERRRCRARARKTCARGGLFPVHWATFNLAFHAWDEPIRRTLAAARARRVDVVTPRLGEMVDADAPFASTPWWER